MDYGFEEMIRADYSCFSLQVLTPASGFVPSGQALPEVALPDPAKPATGAPGFPLQPGLQLSVTP